MSRGIPRGIGATYRLQLVEERGLHWAASIIPYLARLGIETLYLSPVVEAVPGSAHGYDGTDPTSLRRSLGGLAGYVELFHACEAHGLGILVDWVPNHLSTWTDGPWWRRLLTEGRDSEMGQVFDIDWDGGQGQVILPLLDRPLPEALAAGAVTLGVRGGSPVIEVGDTDLPVAGGVVREGEDLVDLLAAQHYRLADWHDPMDRNYRRFFDIDGLVGVRVEDPEVFERTHTLVGALAAAGLLSGVRIDHIDGLAEPAVYLRRLADLVGVPIVVEKILTGDEHLPAGWPVLGTTGYEALDDIAGALVEPEGLRRLVEAGRADGDQPVHTLTVKTRSLVATDSFPADLARAARGLEVPVADLTSTVIRLGRYRTYLTATATATATEGDGEGGPPAPESEDVEVWREGASGDPGRAAVAEAVLDPERRAGTVALQQLTGAVMAKGIEDTAWYRLSGPLAFCEVGGDPAATRDGGWERLVDRAAGRVADGYSGLVPGSTHDTKRSADVRCRLYALSERTSTFEEGLVRLRRRLDLPSDGGEFAAESRMLAQLVLGILPPLSPGDPMAPFAPGDAGWSEDDTLTDRLCGALRKSAREAKRRSSWLHPDVAHEARLEATARRALADGASLVVDAMGSLVTTAARLGAVNALSAVVLRHVLPGIPDCYQGDEVWSLSLVDPDNRRPVDYGGLAIALDSVGPALGGDTGAWRDLCRSWRDGRLKLAITAACLAARPVLQTALATDAPVGRCDVTGPASGSVAALARGSGPQMALGVVTRLPGALGPDTDDLPHGPSFAGTELVLPDAAPSRWRDTLTGRVVQADGGVLSVDQVLAVLPVALLTPEPGPG